MQFLIETAGGKTPRLQVFQSVEAARYARKAFSVLGGLRPDESAVARLFETLPLVEYARARGYGLTLPDSRDRIGALLALEKWIEGLEAQNL